MPLVISCALFSLVVNVQTAFGFAFTELTEDNFDAFVQAHPKVMVDFVHESDKQTTELNEARNALRRYGVSVPLARVNADEQPALAKRYFRGCDAETQLCADSFPRCLWMVDGNATKYHRSLQTADHIFTFAVALDREAIKTVAAEEDLQDFDRYLLFRGERSSELYAMLAGVASRHLDTLAVAHLEEPGSSNVSWIVNRSLNETYAGDDSEAAVEAWIRQHFAFGEAPPAEIVDEDGTTVVVASKFQEQVLGSEQDVFLLVYAPWCGYSRKVLPEWSKLAKVASDSMSGLVVAKMDGDQNIVDTQEYKWTSFPTMVYFKAGVRMPLPYKGARTVEALEAFARRNGANPAGEGAVMFEPRLRGGRGRRKVEV